MSKDTFQSRRTTLGSFLNFRLAKGDAKGEGLNPMRRLSEIFSGPTPSTSKAAPNDKPARTNSTESTPPLSPPAAASEQADPADEEGKAAKGEARLSMRTQPVIVADESVLAGTGTSSLVESDLVFEPQQAPKTGPATEAEKRADAVREEVKAEVAKSLRGEEERRLNAGSNLRRIGYDGAYDKDMKRHGFGRYVYPDGSIYVLLSESHSTILDDRRRGSGCVGRRRVGGS